MPLTAMPAVDVSALSGWSTNDLSLYNALPYYLAKMQADRRKTWTIWNKFTKPRKWKPNMGDTLRAVTAEPSPHLRQFAHPALLKNTPKKDVMNITERKVDAQVYRHRFESPALNFYPSFNDFLDHVDDNAKDIMEKIERFEDIYIRGNIYQMAPFIFVATQGGVKLLDAPYWPGTGTFVENAAASKNVAFLLDAMNQCTSHMTITGLNQALTIAETQLRVPYFSGSDTPSGDDQPLSGKYCFVTSAEAYNQFTFDPYLLQNKNCDLDVVNKSYMGSFFGRVTARLEDLPLRMDAAGAFPAPERRVEDANHYNNGGTEPNPSYALPTNAPYEWGFLCGASGFESIEVGPPPSKFTGDTPPHDFPALFWNGEVKATKQFLLPYIDSVTGATAYEMNTYGEYLKFISQATFGVVPVQRRNIIPVLYKRKIAA